MAGCRIPFWLEVPCIYSDDLQSASEPASSEPGLTSVGPDVSQASRGTPVVDIGIHATGAVGVGIPQAWLPVYQRTDKSGMQRCRAHHALSMLKSTSSQPSYKHLLMHSSGSRPSEAAGFWLPTRGFGLQAYNMLQALSCCSSS